VLCSNSFDLNTRGSDDDDLQAEQTAKGNHGSSQYG
tara:strand:- start:3576 stop:3683 length:108 start_codon:yes stop_codon:yes gene_type:complete